jgi:hypothetical protein
MCAKVYEHLCISSPGSVKAEIQGITEAARLDKKIRKQFMVLASMFIKLLSSGI